MPTTVIKNPVINSPFREPQRHFRFSEDGITDEIVSGRRRSEYFVPVPQPKRKVKQMAFESWTEDRIEENKFINQVRERVAIWHKGGYV
jgi:type III restriction enzyme